MRDSTTLERVGKWVVRRQVNDTEDFVVGDRRTSEDVAEALGFSSRLAAETWAETVGLDGLLWRPVKRADCKVKAKAFESPFALTISDPLEAVELVCRRHWEYCARIEQWLTKAGVALPADHARPTPCMTITAPTWAGLYSGSTHVCHYPVAYAMMAADHQTVVAHEVTHAYQRQFTGHECGHGPDFYAMMAHGMGIKLIDHHHRYSVAEARRLSDKLLPWWSMARERGVLSSLSCEVLTTKTKRKGIK